MSLGAMNSPGKSEALLLPPVDVVVIGVNTGATLGRCLQSIIDAEYPSELLTISYVDGGSTDSSCQVAASFSGVQVIALKPAHPTPGLGRNAGWQAGIAPLVQFLDADTVMARGWLGKAVRAMDEGVAAVAGNRLEMNPGASVFNWIASLEWNGRPGDIESFGGDVLLRRSVLEETGGYDEELVGGEDPELSRRIRILGWRILLLDEEMTHHDLAMRTVKQYWRRAYRSGYAFAAVRDRFAERPSSFWRQEYRRILVRGGGGMILSFSSLFSLFILPAGIAVFTGLLLFLGAVLLIFYPRLFRVDYFRQDKGLERDLAKIYAWHCSLVVVPDIFGVARYHLGKLLGRPLRNRSSRLVR